MQNAKNPDCHLLFPSMRKPSRSFLLFWTIHDFFMDFKSLQDYCTAGTSCVVNNWIICATSRNSTWLVHSTSLSFLLCLAHSLAWHGWRSKMVAEQRCTLQYKAGCRKSKNSSQIVQDMGMNWNDKKFFWHFGET